MPDFTRTVFAVAHTDLKSAPFNNQGRTLRLVVQSNVETEELRVCFSNHAAKTSLIIGAASISRCSEHGVLEPETLSPITVDGVLSFELHPEKDLFSDTIPFCVMPGDYFALNIYYPTEERVVSGNWVSNHSLRSRHGNYSADLEFAAPKLAGRIAKVIAASDMTVPITSVKQIIASCPKDSRVLACFGDSITQQGNWVYPLTKLLHKHYPGEISVCNLGISGNRLIYDAAEDNPTKIHGEAGMKRFERDVLSIKGLSHCIVAIGTNDIGLPGSPGVPESELIGPGEYINAMEHIAAKLKEHGVKAYVATLTPRPLVRPYDAIREEMRLEMNKWIRNNSCFDAVLDFDAALSRDDGEFGMADGCAMADGLHPSAIGGMWMAKSIDISLFE